MLIEAYIDYLRKEKRYSNHTLTAYSKDLQQFSEFILNDLKTGLASVEQNDVRMWIVRLRNADIAPRSINRKLTCLKSFYKYLQSHHDLEQNPTIYIKQLKLEKALPQFVPEDQMEALFKIPVEEGNYLSLMEHIFIRLLYDTGIRVSELISLKKNDINYGKKQIKVLGKRNKERIIPVSDTLLKELREFQIKQYELVGEVVDPEFFFVSLRGKKLYPKLVYRSINSYLSRVTTITKKSPHVIRHTFATHLLNKGAELNAIKDLLGHTSLSATQVYTHNSIKQLKEAYKKAHPKA